MGRKTNQNSKTMIKTILLFICVLSFTYGFGQSSKETADKLIGIWGIKEVHSPDAKGELIIDLRNSNTESKISGFTVPVLMKDSMLTFKLSDDKGEFRGY